MVISLQNEYVFLLIKVSLEATCTFDGSFSDDAKVVSYNIEMWYDMIWFVKTWYRDVIWYDMVCEDMV